MPIQHEIFKNFSIFNFLFIFFAISSLLIYIESTLYNILHHTDKYFKLSKVAFTIATILWSIIICSLLLGGHF